MCQNCPGALPLNLVSMSGSPSVTRHSSMQHCAPPAQRRLNALVVAWTTEHSTRVKTGERQARNTVHARTWRTCTHLVRLLALAVLVPLDALGRVARRRAHERAASRVHILGTKKHPRTASAAWRSARTRGSTRERHSCICRVFAVAACKAITHWWHNRGWKYGTVYSWVNTFQPSRDPSTGWR